MKRETKEIYGSKVHFIQYTGSEIASGNRFEENDQAFIYGDVTVRREEPSDFFIVESVEDVQGRDRTPSIKVGQLANYNEDRTIKDYTVVVAESANDKQMYNILTSVPADNIVLAVNNFSEVVVTEEKEEAEEAVTAEPEKKAPRRRNKKTTE